MKITFTQINILTLLILLFTLSACGSSGGSTVPVEQINYYEGSDGLVFSFLPNNPPEKVYPGQVYPITLQIENKGAFDLAQIENIYMPWGSIPINYDMHAQVNIVYDNLYFAKSDSYQNQESNENITIMGKSVAWPFGQTKMQIVDIVQAQGLGQRSGAETTIMASLCFPYETLLTQEVCIDKDPHDNLDEQVVCHAEDISLRDQGAPIAVTYIDFESTYLPNSNDEGFPLMRPMFILTLQNVGSGQLIRPRSTRTEQKLCVRPINDETPSNAVGIEARIGDMELICQPEYPIFYNGEAEVVCFLPERDSIPVEANYKELFFVILTYVYQIRDEITIEVDDAAGHLQGTTMLDFKCSDFNFDYESCRSYAQSNTDSTNLDCYYCDETRRCLNSNQQSECPNTLSGVAGMDEETRRFVGPCPTGEPSVSVSFDKETNEIKFKCTDPSKVKSIDHNRCGCDNIRYYIHSSADTTCVDEALSIFVSENTARSDAFAVVALSMDTVDRLKLDESFALCYQGFTVDDKNTTIKKYTIKA